MGLFNTLKCKITDHKYCVDKVSDPFEITNIYNSVESQAVNITYKCLNCSHTIIELTKFKLTELYKGENIEILKKLIKEEMLDDGIYNLGNMKLDDILELIDQCKTNYFISFRKQNDDLIAAIIYDDRPKEIGMYNKLNEVI